MDELSRYLSERYPNNYITGKDDCNFLIWGAEAAGVQDPEPKMCSLMIGLEYDPYHLSQAEAEAALKKRLEEDHTLGKLLSYGRQFAIKTQLPFMMIVYPSMRREFEGRWEDSKAWYDPMEVCFYCHSMGTVDISYRGVLKGASLKALIYRNLGVRYTDTGTTKEKNKRLADYFHLWSRDSLTSRIIKFDLDGFLFSDRDGKSALVEIKRSTQSPWIPEWYPIYDKPDYFLQCRFAQMIGADFWLLHHERHPQREERYVSFFEIGNVSGDEPKYFLYFKQRAMRLPLHGERSLDSVVKRFIDAPGTTAFAGLCCPLCGSPIRSGPYSFYCTDARGGGCDMNLGRHYGYVLQEGELRALLAGCPVSYHHNGRNVTLSPRVEPNEYNGRSSYQWKKV